eukprot:188987_1
MENIMLFLLLLISNCKSFVPYHSDGFRLLHEHLGPARHRYHIYKMFGDSLGLYQHRSSIDIKPYAVQKESTPPIIFVTDHGADPTGKVDSTNAFKSAINVALSYGAPNTSLADNIHDCGGATIDLAGGDYIISSPLIIPQFFGNLRIIDGTIRASDHFAPNDSYLLIIGDNSNYTCNTGQKSCNENIGIQNIMFDSKRIVYGNIHIIHTIGAVIGPQMFFLGFLGAGITITGGHEVQLFTAWFGEFIYSTSPNIKKTANSTAIQVFGADHYVYNSIVFNSKIGVHVRNGTALISGVHTWNMADVAGGIGFLNEAAGNRFLGCYFDGNDIVLRGPIHSVSVENCFFLYNAKVILEATSENDEIKGLGIVNNQFNGNGPIIGLNETNGTFKTVIQTIIQGNLVLGPRPFKQRYQVHCV